jgi:serine/threonine protein kinase
MGEVYEAEQIETGRRVALKVLARSLDSPDVTARFLREGRLAAAVSHPNSVYVFGSHDIDHVPMIAMELVPGGTLHEVVEKSGPMPPTRAVDAILQVIAGLEAAADASGAVKIGDYGLSMSTLAWRVLNGIVGLTAIVTLAVGAACSILEPRFSLPDRIARTVIVPK